MDSPITENKIKKAIDGFSMLTDNDSVLVGFSGGKDSVVLLYALKSISEEYKISVAALHVNHNIRGEEAKRDEDFCRSFCEKNNITFVCENVYAVEYANKAGIGLEEAARILRYDAFERTAAKLGITKTATAHTASDNLETVIFNLTRGSSTEGLKGIPPVRGSIIRPLIYCTTDDVLAYAAAKGLQYVTDSTNADTDYARNHIRHKVIPLLKTINPSAENAVSSLCDSVRQDLSFISGCANTIDTDDSPYTLSKLHPALLTRHLADMYKKCSSALQPSHIHITSMADMVYSYAEQGRRDAKKLSLPGKLEFTVTPKKVFFQKRQESAKLEEMPLTPGLTKLDKNGNALLVTADENEGFDELSKNIYKKSIHVIVKKDALADTIIRGRLDGDVFEFSNMTKKVKKMLNEAKIPVDERDRLPFICDKKGIIWIPGFPLRDDAKPKENEKHLHIYYFTQEKTI